MPIHTVVIVAMGVHLMDNLDLDALAAACAEEAALGVPPHGGAAVLRRGTASPVNPIAAVLRSHAGGARSSRRPACRRLRPPRRGSRGRARSRMARKGMPSAAAIASTVPPRSTTATSSTTSPPASLHGVGRLEQRRAAGDGVLGDHHLVAGVERPGDAPAAAVVLRLLAHAERLERAAPRRRHAGGDEGHRVGPHGEAADGGRLGRDDREHGVGHEHHGLGPAHRLLGVDEPAALPPRLEGEVARLDRVLEQVVAAAPRSVSAPLM